MMQFRESLAREDADVMRAIECEQLREQNQIELIASENIVSPADNQSSPYHGIPHKLWI